MIQRRHYPQWDLIVHAVEGPLEEEHVLTAIRALYEMDPPPRLTLWDFSSASLAGFTVHRSRRIQVELAEHVRGRRGGRTAFVAPEDYSFATGRQYATLAESLDLPFEQGVFRTLDEAFAWLGIDPGELEQR